MTFKTKINKLEQQRIEIIIKTSNGLKQYFQQTF